MPCTCKTSGKSTHSRLSINLGLALFVSPLSLFLFRSFSFPVRFLTRQSLHSINFTCRVFRWYFTRAASAVISGRCAIFAEIDDVGERVDRFPRFPREFLKVKHATKRGYFRTRLLHDTRAMRISPSPRSRVVHKCHSQVAGKLRGGEKVQEEESDDARFR